jgi:hypothetical protein
MTPVPSPRGGNPWGNRAGGDRHRYPWTSSHADGRAVSTEMTAADWIGLSREQGGEQLKGCPEEDEGTRPCLVPDEALHGRIALKVCAEHVLVALSTRTDDDDEEQCADHVQASAYQPDRPPGHGRHRRRDRRPPAGLFNHGLQACYLPLRATESRFRATVGGGPGQEWRQEPWPSPRQTVPRTLHRDGQALGVRGPAPRAELLHVLMLPDFDRADRIGSYWANPKTSTFGEGARIKPIRSAPDDG